MAWFIFAIFAVENFTLRKITKKVTQGYGMSHF